MTHWAAMPLHQILLGLNYKDEIVNRTGKTESSLQRRLFNPLEWKREGIDEKD